MTKIVKKDVSAFEKRLRKRLAGETDAEPFVRYIHDDKGNAFQITEGLGEKLLVEYSRPDPSAKLSALLKAQELAADYLLADSGFSVQITQLLAETHKLIGDMQAHAHNPLIDYARTPGRKGHRSTSHWDTDAKRCMAIAARARCKLAKADPARTDTPTYKSAYQWVWKYVDKKLRELGLGPLDKRLPGSWGHRKAEGAEQKKGKATGGERIEGWVDDFRQDDDSNWKVFSDALDALQSPDEIACYVERMLNGAIDRLASGLPYSTNKRTK